MKWTCLCVLTTLLTLGIRGEQTVMEPFPDSRNVSLVFETFSMSQADAAELIRSAIPDSKLYETCVEGTATTKAKQESLTVIRMAAGTTATSRSVLERIYPSEAEPPELPNSIGNFSLDRPPQAPVSSPSTPTAFRTQQLGLILEVRDGPFSSKDLISLEVFPEWIRDRGRSTHGKGLAEVKMPEFEKQDVRFLGDLTAGVPTLLGTFNRAPALDRKEPSEPRVWFAFATAKMIEP